MIITWIVTTKELARLIGFSQLIRLSVLVIQVGLGIHVKCNKNTLIIVTSGVYKF